jgi:hypothetical protein
VSTNYTGVATATQAPSGPPLPGGAPIVQIPSDGDSENAASVTQMVKVLADWITAGFSPRARLATLAAHWPEGVIRFASALLHTRFGIDHLGLPAGRIVHWNEDWSRGVAIGTQSATPIEVNGGFGQTFLDQLQLCAGALLDAGTQADLVAAAPNGANKIVAAGNKLSAALVDAHSMDGNSSWRHRIPSVASGSAFVNYYPPDSGAVMPRFRYVGLGAGNTIGDYTILYRRASASFHDDVHIALQWASQLEAANMGSKLAHMAGFAAENNAPNVYGFGSGTNYAVFGLTYSGNWFARTASGGVETATDTGVAPSTNWTRFRIELHGATVAEDATKTVRYFINDVQVAAHITNIPSASSGVAPHFSLGNQAGGAHGLGIPVRLSPVQYAQPMFPANVFP